MTGGKAARAKGNKAERDVARWLRDHGWPDARTTRDARGGSQGGADITGVPGWSIEVKHRAEPRLIQWWEQTVDQADDANPLLIWRLPGVPNPGSWLAVTGPYDTPADKIHVLYDTVPARDWPSLIRIGGPLIDQLGTCMVAICSLYDWAYIARLA